MERKVVVLGAHDLSSPYKGVQYSVEALRGLHKDCVIVTFGHGPIDTTGIVADVTHLGFVTGATAMAEVYSAADVVLATSVAEAFGKTVAEAQCCGIPVVAFNDTGPRDIVEHRVTGYLASPRDSGDVLFGLRYCLESPFDHGHISQRARHAFSIQRCTEQYVELYRMVLAAPLS